MILTFLAKIYAKLYSKDIIGVCGSVGRTICVKECGAVLSQRFKTLTGTSNLSPSLNIPRTMLKLTPQIKKVVLDMGVLSIGEMDSYLSLIQPKVVVCTKIAYSDLGNFEGLDEIALEIGKLIKQLDPTSVLISNWDDQISKNLAKGCTGSVVYYGVDPQNCTVWAGNIKVEDFKTHFELNLGVERVKVNLNLCGSHQVYPALAAAALGVVNDVPLTKIKIGLESIQPSEHNLQAVPGPNGSVILDDSLDSSPVSLDAAIDTLLEVSARRRVLVLGEMRNLGKHSENLHRQVAQKIFKEKIDFCFLGGGDAKLIADELKSLGFWEERVESNLQNSQIVATLLKTLGKGDVALIKGSSAIRLDEVVKRIAKK